MVSGSEDKSCQEYCQAQKTIRIMAGKMKKKAGLSIWAHINRKKQTQRFIISIIITGNLLNASNRVSYISGGNQAVDKTAGK